MATQGIVVDNVSKSFGGVWAIKECSLSIPEGSITGLIGPNGAGKTTLFNIIAGLHRPSSGHVRMGGVDITGRPPHELFQLGLVRTFQIPHEFSQMTLLENLMVVPPGQRGENLFYACLRGSAVRQQEDAIRTKAYDVLTFLNLKRLAGERAGHLSGGQKKLLELGRTMMTDAKVVLLDEIAAGVNRTLLTELAGHIRRLNRERGYTFCLIEHDMDLIAKLCEPVVVMAQGSVMMVGKMDEIRRTPKVVEAYLGHGKMHRAKPASSTQALAGSAG